MDMSASLKKHALWDASRDSHHQVTSTGVRLHYERAKLICKASGITIDDVLHLTPKFWRLHTNMINTRDLAAFTITTIHLNLCIGTIARFLGSRPDLRRILDDLIEFKTCGEFLLTEIGHGLDVRNLETTATMLEDGSFVLNTPNFNAAKAMPPATPLAGFPRLAVVFARLIVRGESSGVKTFLVTLNNASQMYPGVTSRALPIRPGTKPLDHSITTFNNVKLAPGALLGSVSKATDEREDFLDQIWRVSVGTLALSMLAIPCLKLAGSLVATYSQHRHVGTGRGTQTMPVINFSTQSRPILTALALAEVLDAFADWAIQEFMNVSHSADVRRGVATAFKALAMRSSRAMGPELSDRCGWQGLFTHNQLSELALSFQGNSIAEGDTMVLCIRLASEILTGKYRLPEPVDGQTHLAKYEEGLFHELIEKTISLSDSHRSEGFNAGVLPRCRTMVEALGQRMAFEAAKSKSLAPEILDVFVMCCIREDPSWYIEHEHFTRAQIWQDEESAFEKLQHLLPQLVEKTGARDYITAPMIGEQDLHEFILTLPTFGSGSDIIKSSWKPRL